MNIGKDLVKNGIQIMVANLNSIHIKERDLIKEIYKIYKGCEIEVKREKSLSGDDMLFFSIFDHNLEVSSGFFEGEDTVKDYLNSLKHVVDDYRENPEEYNL